MSQAKELNLLEGSLWDKMIIIALPLAFTGVLQQLFNAADVAVLGHYVSSDAMAAVGNNVPVIGLIVSLCMGLALGVNVVTARYLGMRQKELASESVHTAFARRSPLALPLPFWGKSSAASSWMCLTSLRAFSGTPKTTWRVYLAGIPFIAVYNFLASVFRSKGDTKTPLWRFGAATVFNIAGNLFFVLVCGCRPGGVALATALANALAAAILVVCLMRRDDELRLIPARLFTVNRTALKNMVRIGWPAGLQSMVFSLSNLIIQAAINSLGPDAMAGSVAAFTIEINVYCFINAFGLTATTFVSQNWGAGNLARCRRATLISMGLNFAATFVLVAFIWIFARELLACFTTDESVIALGLTCIFWVVLPEPVNVIMETLSDAMRGFGYSLPPQW